ncbi:hypothetical protein ACWDA3_24410 [Nonomuraea rubra]
MPSGKVWEPFWRRIAPTAAGCTATTAVRKVPSVKRRLLGDTLGTVVTACFSPASVNDRDGAGVLLVRVGELLRR